MTVLQSPPRSEHLRVSRGAYRISGAKQVFGAGTQPMQCPYCQGTSTRVIDTTHDAKGGVRRRRVCKVCGERYSTYERAILTAPLLIKADNSREEFDREKLARGVRIACAKRPVSATDIDRLVGEVESRLQSLGKPEIPARVVGDLVINGLKELDHIAYIRYAIVYLGLDDLQSIRNEIDQLLEA